MPFPPSTKAAWLAKVRQEQKGKNPSVLDFTVAGRAFSPFHHLEDQPVAYAPVRPPRTEPVAIGVALDAGGDPAAVNALLLDQLTKGANAIFLHADAGQPDPAGRLDDLLAGVYREIIDVYLMHGNAGHRALDYALFTAHDDPTPEAEPQTAAAGRMLAHYARALADHGGPLPQTPAFWLTVNDDYLTNVALLRALRLGHGRVDELNGHPPRPCRLVADCFTAVTDKYTGMVATTANVMSAVVGTADVVFVPHASPDTPAEETFLRRVALNTANVLHHEAHLDRVADPAAGSYYLEALTDHLAGEIWGEMNKNIEG